MATTTITDRPADEMFGYKFGVDGLLTMQEVCELLSVSDDTIERMVARQELRKGKTPTGRVRFCKRSVMTYIARLEV